MGDTNTSRTHSKYISRFRWRMRKDRQQSEPSSGYFRRSTEFEEGLDLEFSSGTWPGIHRLQGELDLCCWCIHSEENYRRSYHTWTDQDLFTWIQSSPGVEGKKLPTSCAEQKKPLDTQVGSTIICALLPEPLDLSAVNSTIHSAHL